jgi:hypothetical protein
MSGYFRKEEQLDLPPDPDPDAGGPIRVFCYGKWMTYDEFIIERVRALGREQKQGSAPVENQPDAIVPEQAEMFGSECATDKGAKGFDDRVKPRKRPSCVKKF